MLKTDSLRPLSMDVLDSWAVSQTWLDFDSNESSQSRVGRENQEHESSQRRITLIVIWVRVESTGYCLSQSWGTYVKLKWVESELSQVSKFVIWV